MPTIRIEVLFLQQKKILPESSLLCQDGRVSKVTLNILSIN